MFWGSVMEAAWDDLQNSQSHLDIAPQVPCRAPTQNLLKAPLPWNWASGVHARCPFCQFPFCSPACPSFGP